MLLHQTFTSVSLSSSANLHTLICLSIRLPQGDVFWFGSNVCQTLQYKSIFHISTGITCRLDVITASVMCYFCCCVYWPPSSSGNGCHESWIQPSDCICILQIAELIIHTTVMWSKLLNAGKYILNIKVWHVCLSEFLQSFHGWVIFAVVCLPL